MSRTCDGCRRPFTPRQRNGRFCSAACRREARKSPGYDRTCEVCGTMFHARMPWAKHCSSTCKAAAHRDRRRGGPHTAERRGAPQAGRSARRSRNAAAPASAREAPEPVAINVVAVEATDRTTDTRTSAAARAAERKRNGREVKLSTVRCERPGCSAFVPQRALSYGDRWCSHECAVVSNPAAMALCPSVFTTQDGRPLFPR